jgi:hypothetical protein
LALALHTCSYSDFRSKLLPLALDVANVSIDTFLQGADTGQTGVPEDDTTKPIQSFAEFKQLEKEYKTIFSSSSFLRSFEAATDPFRQLAYPAATPEDYRVFNQMLKRKTKSWRKVLHCVMILLCGRQEGEILEKFTWKRTLTFFDHNKPAAWPDALFKLGGFSSGMFPLDSTVRQRAEEISGHKDFTAVFSAQFERDEGRGEYGVRTDLIQLLCNWAWHSIAVDRQLEPVQQYLALKDQVSGLQVQPVQTQCTRSIHCLAYFDLLLSLSALGSSQGGAGSEESCVCHWWRACDGERRVRADGENGEREKGGDQNGGQQGRLLRLRV